MNRCGRLLLLFAVVAALTGCGTTVEVPAAFVGKLSTSSGLQAGIIQPSKQRLSNMCLTCDSLIIAEASDFPIKESMQIFMPKDTLNLTVEVRGTVAITSDAKNVEMIFARIPATAREGSDRVSVISMVRVYETYAQPIIREVVRSIVTKYTITHVMENRDSISIELTAAVRAQLADTPIGVVQFGLADCQPPAVIVQAQENAKEREIAIQKAEANKQVALKEAEANYEVAIKQQQVDLKEAETQVLVERKLSEGVNKAFVAQRALRVLEKLADSDNKVFFLPQETFSNPALILGAVQESFKDNDPAPAPYVPVSKK